MQTHPLNVHVYTYTDCNAVLGRRTQQLSELRAVLPGLVRQDYPFAVVKDLRVVAEARRDCLYNMLHIAGRLKVRQQAAQGSEAQTALLMHFIMQIAEFRARGERLPRRYIYIYIYIPALPRGPALAARYQAPPYFVQIA
jgi:hypothetical protein